MNENELPPEEYDNELPSEEYDNELPSEEKELNSTKLIKKMLFLILFVSCILNLILITTLISRKSEKETLKANIETLKANIETLEANIETPKANIEAPKDNIKSPEVNFEFKKDNKLDKKIFLSIKIGEKKPIEIHKNEVKLILKMILQATKEIDPHDRFNLYTTNQNDPKILFDRFSGNTWIYNDNKFIKINIESQPAPIELNKQSGELIESFVNRTGQYRIQIDKKNKDK